jgi:chemotaxis protein CheD
MLPPKNIVEVFLLQGEVIFGDRNTRIHTVLGSCVAITMWHPEALLGGMCHYMLPSRGKPGSHELDGKYADEALALMLDKIHRAGTSASEYQIKLFGGGDMFPGTKSLKSPNVGTQNVEIGRQLLKDLGLSIHAEHICGVGHRNLIFDIWSGDVWMKHQPPVDNCKSLKPCLEA